MKNFKTSGGESWGFYIYWESYPRTKSNKNKTKIKNLLTIFVNKLAYFAIMKTYLVAYFTYPLQYIRWR